VNRMNRLGHLYLASKVKGTQVRMDDPALMVLSVDMVVYFNDFEAPKTVGSVCWSGRLSGLKV
jgi:hypothetical protein